MSVKFHIGCSGYNYREWKGNFYPDGLPQSKWLEFYCRYFDTIEINASFYKFPTVKTLQNWYNKTPEGFTFSLKVNKQITHFQKFHDTEKLVAEFYETAAEGLKEKLDCLLFQLPPSMKYDQSKLEVIVSQFDNAYKNVLEFRDAGWWNEDVYHYLKSKGVVFCVSSFPDLPDDFVKTSDTVYVRLHGKTELYKSSYSDKELKALISDSATSKAKEVYIYFDNTWGGNAISNAKTIQHLLSIKP